MGGEKAKSTSSLADACGLGSSTRELAERSRRSHVQAEEPRPHYSRKTRHIRTCLKFGSSQKLERAVTTAPHPTKASEMRNEMSTRQRSTQRTRRKAVLLRKPDKKYASVPYTAQPRQASFPRRHAAASPSPARQPHQVSASHAHGQQTNHALSAKLHTHADIERYGNRLRQHGCRGTSYPLRPRCLPPLL